MDRSKQHLRPASVGPMGERSTLIELLVVIAIIGVLIAD
jgi:prepilin-type N-terminal cleavage/methylation domain-containing protein